MLWAVSFTAASPHVGEKRGVRSEWTQNKRERTGREKLLQMSAGIKNSYGERGKEATEREREREGRMYRENWIGKQQRVGRSGRDEIAWVEWQQNERGWKGRREAKLEKSKERWWRRSFSYSPILYPQSGFHPPSHHQPEETPLQTTDTH